MAVYRIKEYGKIRRKSDSRGTADTTADIFISDKSFSSIWDYILEFQSRDSNIDRAFKLFTRNGRKTIQAQNYVGLIETSEKETIEILPKIYSNGKDADIDTCKRILLRMLATLRGTPFINMQSASLETKTGFPILEIFIYNFVVEVENLVSKGLKKGYIKTTANSNFLKGQLLFSENLLLNLVDKSRFLVRYSSYEYNIPQNRLIKAALDKLFSVSTSNKNRSRIRHLLQIFETVESSKNVSADLGLSKSGSRLFSEYEMAIQWSEIFLLNQSFTAFAGKSINQALLFPMEVLFESYIAQRFKRHAHNHTVHTQHNSFFLISKHLGKEKFRLRPDLYLEAKEDVEECFVMDTKWKLIDENLTKRNYLINQGDMYQLYAYGRKYIKDGREPRLVLIYPLNNNFNKALQPFYYETTNGDDHLRLTAIPFDLLDNTATQIDKIIEVMDIAAGTNKTS